MLPMQRAMSLSTSSIRLPFLQKADGYHPYQRCLHRSDGRRGRTEGGPASCYGQSYHGQTAHFDVVSKRKDDVDIYKHEQESMRRSYIENYYNAMDTVIQLLDNSQTVPSWKETRYKKMLDVLKIKSTEEFDMLYTIDMSYLFFFRTIPIQSEALDDGISAYFERAEKKEEVLRLLKRCLAKQTIAIALRRFDILDFPSTIRNLFEDSKVMRYGTQEQERLLALSDALLEEVKRELANIDLLLSTDSSGSVDTNTSFNRPDDIIMLMPC